jgi:hypothetical protein
LYVEFQPKNKVSPLLSSAGGSSIITAKGITVPVRYLSSIKKKNGFTKYPSSFLLSISMVYEEIEAAIPVPTGTELVF